MALTNAERQQRRRDKLKNLAEEAKYDPKQFIAYSVRDLFNNKQISQDLLSEIEKQALVEAKQILPDCDKVKEIFIAKKIHSFLNDEIEV